MYKQMYEEAKFNNDQKRRRDRMIHENSQSDRDEYLRQQREHDSKSDEMVVMSIVAAAMYSDDSNDRGSSSCD